MVIQILRKLGSIFLTSLGMILYAFLMVAVIYLPVLWIRDNEVSNLAAVFVVALAVSLDMTLLWLTLPISKRINCPFF